MPPDNTYITILVIIIKYSSCRVDNLRAEHVETGRQVSRQKRVCLEKHDGAY